MALSTENSLNSHSKPSRKVLLYFFILWKSILAAVALGGSTRGYDTSSTLVASPYSENEDLLNQWSSIFDLETKLTRWDAIYFMQIARRGYLFEQEWAFGIGLPAMIRGVVMGLQKLGLSPNLSSIEPVVGIVVAHASHLLSVLALHELGAELSKNRRVGFVAALLHIISPAGIFLSAPYQESTYAALSFAGYLIFARAQLASSNLMRRDSFTVLSGILFGAATLFRSNGLLNGIPFTAFALLELSRFVKTPTLNSIRSLVALGLASLLLIAGFIGPQAVAYKHFCLDSELPELPPWCERRIPGVYTFVQEKYWNVGFLRYWNIPNIPLFFLAAPMLYVMLRSGIQALKNPLVGKVDGEKPASAPNLEADGGRTRSLLIQSMAASQILLTVMAITTYHVQIITRISSGYPLWCLWLAKTLVDGTDEGPKFGRSAVKWMTIYGMVQGALFASFLPPA